MTDVVGAELEFDALATAALEVAEEEQIFVGYDEGLATYVLGVTDDTQVSLTPVTKAMVLEGDTAFRVAEECVRRLARPPL